MKLMGLAGDPGFIKVYHITFVDTLTFMDHNLASLLFAISGGIWGVIFRIIPEPEPLKGLLFGLLPSLWVWTAVAIYTGTPLFYGFTFPGIVKPLFFNCLIWGTFIGWFVSTNSRIDL